MKKKIVYIAIFLFLILLILFLYHINNQRQSISKETFNYIEVTPSGNVINKSFGSILRNVAAVEKVAQTYRTIKPTAQRPLPTNFDGTQVWTNMLTPVGNQGVCGNCWAYGTSYSLADRYAILSVGQIKFVPSASELAECAHKFGENIADVWENKDALQKIDDDMHANMSCNGASLYDAADTLYTDGVPDINCFTNPFTSGGKSYDITTTEDSTKLPYCYTIEGIDFDTCSDGKTAMKKYRAQTAYNVASDEQSIMHEIYRWGPITTGIMVFPDFMTGYDGTTIYTHPDKTAQSIGGHCISVVGWGEAQQDGQTVKYWICRNSWGTDWGVKGYFKMQRGLTDVQLEQNCLGMLPDFPGMTIVNPDIIPIETQTEIDVHKFTKHFIDPLTGFYTTGLQKISQCVLKGDTIPYINPAFPLPDYTKFWAADIAGYIAQIPASLPPESPVAVCGTPYNPNIALPPAPIMQAPPAASDSSTPSAPIVPIPSSTPSVTSSSSTPWYQNKSLIVNAAFGLLAVGGCYVIWKYGPSDTAERSFSYGGSLPQIPIFPSQSLIPTYSDTNTFTPQTTFTPVGNSSFLNLQTPDLTSLPTSTSVGSSDVLSSLTTPV